MSTTRRPHNIVSQNSSSCSDQRGLRDLEETLQVQFNDRSLIERALRHSSISSSRITSYERLEFLGDRVLGLAIADLLTSHFPDDSEGELARRLSHLVSTSTLKSLGQRLRLADHIKSEEKLLPRRSTSIIADVLEAILGVIYLEHGFKVAKGVIAQIYGKRLTQSSVAPKDSKSSLQELGQKKFNCLPTYQLVSQDGPSHAPEFKVSVELAGQKATASAYTRRDAEKKAAKKLLSKF